MTSTRTHTAPHTRATHRGPAARCPEYPCAPGREAAAHLREDQPLTAVEQAAWDAVQDRMWILWHANNRDLGVLLMLSRAGLLRDLAHEKQQSATDQAMARISERSRRADTTAIAHLGALAEQAAQRLTDGDDPQSVASWLRDTAAAIASRRENAHA